MSLSTAEKKSTEKFDYEILFKDSAEYFVVKNSKMIQEGAFVRFLSFEDSLPISKLREEQWYPIVNIHRIKRYHQISYNEQIA